MRTWTLGKCLAVVPRRLRNDRVVRELAAGNEKKCHGGSSPLISGYCLRLSGIVVVSDTLPMLP